MQVKGTIRDIKPSVKDGVQRTWEKDGKVLEFWTAFIDVPRTVESGKTYTDEIIAEFSRERMDGNTSVPYGNYIGTENASINLMFARREYNGSHFQTIRMGQVSFTAV